MNFYRMKGAEEVQNAPEVHRVEQKKKLKWKGKKSRQGN